MDFELSQNGAHLENKQRTFVPLVVNSRHTFQNMYRFLLLNSDSDPTTMLLLFYNSKKIYTCKFGTDSKLSVIRLQTHSYSQITQKSINS